MLTWIAFMHCTYLTQLHLKVGEEEPSNLRMIRNGQGKEVKEPLSYGYTSRAGTPPLRPIHVTQHTWMESRRISCAFIAGSEKMHKAGCMAPKGDG